MATGTLTNSSIKDRYKSLLKLSGTANDVLAADASAKYVEDGDGNDSALSLSTNRVGIGTNTPDYLLDVENASGHSRIRIHAGTDSSAQLLLQNNAQIWNINCQTSDKFAIYDDTADTERLVILTDGKVGIGTNAPDQLLHLESSTPMIVLEDSDGHSSNDEAWIHHQKSGAAGTYLSSIKFDRNGVTSGFMQFLVNNGSPLTAMTILHDGRVGIGTDDPDDELHVAAIGDQASSIFIDGGSGQNAALKFGDGGSTTGYALLHDASGHGSGDDALTFSKGDGTEIMCMTNGANVGIGTTTPTANSALHVYQSYTQSASSTSKATTTGEQYGLYTSTTYGYSGGTQGGLKQGLRVNCSTSHTSNTISDCIGALSLATASGNGGTTTDLMAAYLRTDTASGSTATNAYACYLGASVNSGTITNRYGLYSADTAATNYFAGDVGIGIAAPTSELHVKSLSGSDCFIKVDTADGDGSATADAGISFCEQGAMNFMMYNDGSYAADDGRLYVVDRDSNNGVYLVEDATSWTSNSDERMKENLVELTSATTNLNTLRCVNYNNKNGSTKSKAKKRIGLIAQDVYKVYPEVVTGKPEDNYQWDESANNKNVGAMGINYQELVPVLVKAIQELSEKVTVLENK